MKDLERHISLYEAVQELDDLVIEVNHVLTWKDTGEQLNEAEIETYLLYTDEESVGD